MLRLIALLMPWSMRRCSWNAVLFRYKQMRVRGIVSVLRLCKKVGGVRRGRFVER